MRGGGGNANSQACAGVGADLPGFTMAADLPAGGTLYFFSRKSRTRLAVPQSSPAPPASLWMSGQVEVSPWVLNSPG
jgi:hypothetical protein